jgi:hypothetical protein
VATITSLTPVSSTTVLSSRRRRNLWHCQVVLQIATHFPLALFIRSTALNSRYRLPISHTHGHSLWGRTYDNRRTHGNLIGKDAFRVSRRINFLYKEVMDGNKRLVLSIAASNASCSRQCLPRTICYTAYALVPDKADVDTSRAELSQSITLIPISNKIHTFARPLLVVQIRWVVQCHH